MFSLFLIGIYFVLSEACTTYNFEDRYSDDFTNQRGLCDGQPMWLLRNYTEIEVERPHELSEKFISPNPSISCVASFLFEVTANGTIEINVYMETSNLNDQISIMANEVRTNDDDATVGHVLLGPRFTPDFTSGWHLLQLTLTGSGTYTGYRALLVLCLLTVSWGQRLTDTSSVGSRNTGGYGLLRPGYNGYGGYGGYSGSGYTGYGGYSGTGYQGGYTGLGGGIGSYNPGYGGYNTGYNGYNSGYNGYSSGYNGYNTGYNSAYNPGYNTGFSGGYRPNYRPGYEYNRPGYQSNLGYSDYNRPGYQYGYKGYERPYSGYSGNYFGGYADGYDNVRLGRKAEDKKDN